MNTGLILLLIFIIFGCISMAIYFNMIVDDIMNQSQYFLNPYFVKGVVFMVLFFGGVWFVVKTIGFLFLELINDIKSKYL